jgi:small subunit ribosomal protein S21
MLIVKVKNGNIEQALKKLKSKVIKTRQNSILKNRMEYVKKSKKRRDQINRAIYSQKFKNNL